MWDEFIQNFFFSYLGLPVPDEMITNQEFTVNINSGKLKLKGSQYKASVEIKIKIWYKIKIIEC
jgi:hypothetical protein